MAIDSFSDLRSVKFTEQLKESRSKSYCIFAGSFKLNMFYINELRLDLTVHQNLRALTIVMLQQDILSCKAPWKQLFSD